jgi:orotate phosphoribosyltransferase
MLEIPSTSVQQGSTMSMMEEFIEAGAILKGHFILSSGLHSDTYIQCARLLMDPVRAERACKQLAEKIHAELSHIDFDIIVAPAMGGVVVGYEMGRQLSCETMFCERVDGEFALRRGFSMMQGAKVLVVEDVVTTGKSSLETFECVTANGGIVVAEAALIDRRGSTASPLGVPLVALLTLEVPAFDANALPAYLASIPAIKPGSRFFQPLPNEA